MEKNGRYSKKKKKKRLLATVVQFQTVEKNRDLIIGYVYYIGFKVTWWTALTEAVNNYI